MEYWRVFIQKKIIEEEEFIKEIDIEWLEIEEEI